MKLTPHELDKIKLHNAGFIAQKRLAKGIRLNVPEVIALLATQILEYCREGYSVADLMDRGKQLLGFRQVCIWLCCCQIVHHILYRNDIFQVIPGVADIVNEVQIEGTFPDGTKLVTVHDPICRENGDLAACLYGSFLPVPSLAAFKEHPEEGLVPGKIYTMPGSLRINADRKYTYVEVRNIGDR